MFMLGGVTYALYIYNMHAYMYRGTCMCIQASVYTFQAYIIYMSVTRTCITYCAKHMSCAH